MSFAAGFTILFFGVAEIYAGNRNELKFSFGDFAGYALLAALAVFLILTALLSVSRGKLFYVLFGFVFWIAVMGYIQGNFLNIGLNSLSADDTGSRISAGATAINTLIWIFTGIGCIGGALKMKKHELIRTAAIIILVTVCGMQLVSCVAQSGKIIGDGGGHSPETESTTETKAVPAFSDGTDETAETAAETTEKPEEAEKETEKMYLSSGGLYEVSKGKNIIVFLLDRFDVSYYQDITEKDPAFFAKLDGFSYYDDNLSLYSRTYPAVTEMITGIDTDFSTTADEYFTRAYQNSGFLRDLKSNGYKIKIYSSDYYAYRDAKSLYGIADNVLPSNGHIINDRAKLVCNMMALSAYRSAPMALKPAIKISTSSFVGVVSYNGNEPAYEIDDAAVWEGLRANGLSADESENSYIFIHLNGCHSPYYMDEDGNRVDDGEEIPAIRGDFKMIYEYINELKRLGVYDDSTIIITGDHPRARDDGEAPTQPRVTALFVKESGKSGTPLEYSHSQVSSDNLIPTLVKSAGVKTETDYGKSYSEIPEGKDMRRRYKFQLYDGGLTYIIEYAIVGTANDFRNWTEVSRTNIGELYK